MNGGPGSTSGAFIRGANRGQTLVLIDGLRVGSSSVGATSLEAIPLDQIERIEILRGPASSLYGADAIGGVIQVFTKRRRATAFVASVAAGYGTYDTRNASAGCAARWARSLFASRRAARRSSGFNAIVNPDNFSYNDDPDGYSTENVGVNAVLPWAPGQECRGAVLSQPPQQPVRRRRGLRRPHDHDARGVVGRRAATRSASAGRRPSRRAKAATTRCRRPASATSRSRRRSVSTSGRTT